MKKNLKTSRNNESKKERKRDKEEEEEEYIDDEKEGEKRRTAIILTNSRNIYLMSLLVAGVDPLQKSDCRRPEYRGAAGIERVEYGVP